MGDSSSISTILEFLKKNGFTKAEAALRSEMTNQPDLNGFRRIRLEEEVEEDEGGDSFEEQNAEAELINSKESGPRHGGKVSKELIVKEIECGSTQNSLSSNWKSFGFTTEHNAVPEALGPSDNSFIFSIGSEDTVLDLQSRKFNPSNGPFDSSRVGSCVVNLGVLQIENSEQLKLHIDKKVSTDKIDAKSAEGMGSNGDKRASWVGSTSKANVPPKFERNDKHEVNDIDQRKTHSVSVTETDLADDLWWRNNDVPSSSSEQWKEKECSVKTVFPFPKMDVPAYDDYEDAISISEKKEGKRKTEAAGIKAAIKEQVDEVGRSLYLSKIQGLCNEKSLRDLGLPFSPDHQREELPRLPPVRLKSGEKTLASNWEEKLDHDGTSLKFTSADGNHLIGSYLDIPLGQEISASGGKRTAGGSWLSVSQGIAEDASDLVSGFATIGDGLSESIEYPNEYWDSDEYDDDDDVGYTRQPIEDETWFLAHEIDYPSDNEKGTAHGSVPDNQERSLVKVEDDNQSFAEEDSYLSGETYLLSRNVEPISASDDPIGLSVTEIYGRTDGNDLISQYDGQLMDEEELNLIRSEPVWEGFVTQSNDLIMLGNGKILNDYERPRLDDLCMEDDHYSSVRSIGVGINSDAADIGSERKGTLVGESREGDLEYFHDHNARVGWVKRTQKDIDPRQLDRTLNDKKKKHDIDKFMASNDRGAYVQAKTQTDCGFSFPAPARDELMHASSSKSLWSRNSSMIAENKDADYSNATICNDDMLASWRQKSSDSSPIRSSRDEDIAASVSSAESTPSTLLEYVYAEKAHAKEGDYENTDCRQEEDAGASVEDEETAAVQEQVRQIKMQEEEFETFNLKIVHRKNRTGFEEDKNFHVVLNSVIAGRYHVTEYLGSAAFSKAIQAHDLHTGMDVCVKIIKNNKDFFDQSLDEIKLLKYVNKHDPADRHHLLRLYDYFYYREHLLIVCELLKANLYEFHKFNRESGGEVYFTMPRLQSITIQVLEAIQFLHGLGLIHCDLKPENILVKSYSRCEVKVIDLGSSCFETDHLCSYVQSRSYRAPEVILGLPYDKKIDIWSLGCILAELCTGNVLFQNDSPATLLARVIGIIGPIDQDMLAKGRDTYKYITKNHMLYERNQETNRLEYLIPKKSSLRHRLPMGDQGFVDFVAYLLEVNPKKRPSASEALKHPWLSYPYEPISS
ncbi:hypothetical protein Droror1_Dr00007576 [Drosera rotundifolia]